MRQLLLVSALAIASVVAAPTANAQILNTQALSLEAAQQMAQAAQAEAERNNWPVAIAITDIAGELILFHRMDGTQIGSIDVALEKARTSARFRRPTQAFAAGVNGGAIGLMGIDMMPVQGGLPITVGGEVIGGIGVSGVQAPQDEQVAQAGIDAL